MLIKGVIKVENEELIKLYRQGNKKALETLIHNNKGLVFNIVNKFYTENTNSIDIEDLEQEGIIGLIEAADKYNFDHENKAKFSTYAVYRIYQKISNFMRSKNTNYEISLNTTTKEDDSIELIDTIANNDNSFLQVEDSIYIMELRKELEQAMSENNSLYEINLLKLRYGWDDNKICTYKELGEIFNSNAKKTSRDEYKALNKLRLSSWGREKEKEYFGAKLRSIQESSRYNQDSSINVMNIIDKYFNGVL